MITLTINGRSVEVNDGSTLLDVANEAGVYIPTLCYHPRLHRMQYVACAWSMLIMKK